MRILIVGPSWVGDAVMAQSLYKIIKSKNDNQIDVLSPEWSLGILERMEEISDVIISPFQHGELKLKERISLGKTLSKNNYDQSIVLTNSFKSSLIPYFSDIPIRTGWLGEFRYGLINDVKKFNKHDCPLMVERFAMLYKENLKLKEIPKPSLRIDKNNIEKLKKDHLIDDSMPCIALCPGAEFGPAKRWPSFHYSEVASHYLLRGWNVFILGSSKDVSVAKEIREALPASTYTNFFDLTGKTTLPDAIDILSISDVVLTNDSGLMHIAAATGTPLLALYGPSSPEFTPPLSEKARILRKAVGYSKVRKTNTKEGYHPSLLNLKPSEIMEELDTLLDNKK